MALIAVANPDSVPDGFVIPGQEKSILRQMTWVTTLTDIVALYPLLPEANV
jgi:hypothetical protein